MPCWGALHINMRTRMPCQDNSQASCGRQPAAYMQCSHRIAVQHCPTVVTASCNAAPSLTDFPSKHEEMQRAHLASTSPVSRGATPIVVRIPQAQQCIHIALLGRSLQHAHR